MENYTTHPQEEESKKVKKKTPWKFQVNCLPNNGRKLFMLLFLIKHLYNANWREINKAALPPSRKIRPIIHMGFLQECQENKMDKD